jgi:hypothetical protein
MSAMQFQKYIFVARGVYVQLMFVGYYSFRLSRSRDLRKKQ